jgi:hypothetical protein
MRAVPLQSRIVEEKKGNAGRQAGGRGGRMESVEI